MQLTFKIDAADLSHLRAVLAPGRIPLALASVLAGSMDAILRRAMFKSPVRMGNLRRSGGTLIDRHALHAIVGFGAKYAGFVESGTNPHVIAASHAPRLAFIPTSFDSLKAASAAASGQRLSGRAKEGQEGLYIYPFSVFHPGNKENPFLESAYLESKMDISEMIQAAMRRWMRAEAPSDAP